MNKINIVVWGGETPPCRFWHRWKRVRNTGINQYYQCKDCNSRLMKSHSDGYQPIDFNWLYGTQ